MFVNDVEQLSSQLRKLATSRRTWTPCSNHQRKSRRPAVRRMASSLAVVLRAVFFVLGCVTAATVVYTIVTDGSPFRKELLTSWMASTLLDFYVHVIIIWVWVVYKEANWISVVAWLVLLVCLGSIATCGYIVLQFLKLSPQESADDPLYYVLLRYNQRDDTEERGKFSVVIARVFFGALGLFMLAVMLYTTITDGSPFRPEVFTPWYVALLVDFFVNVAAISVWVVYKESSWIRSLPWIILIAFFGSFITCAYISVQLFRLSSHDPPSLLLCNSSNSARFISTPGKEHADDVVDVEGMRGMRQQC